MVKIKVLIGGKALPCITIDKPDLWLLIRKFPPCYAGHATASWKNKMTKSLATGWKLPRLDKMTTGTWKVWGKVKNTAYETVNSAQWTISAQHDFVWSSCILDVLWSQPIKLAQVASTSELLKNLRNDLIFFKIISSHFCRTSEASKIDSFKN